MKPYTPTQGSVRTLAALCLSSAACVVQPALAPPPLAGPLPEARVLPVGEFLVEWTPADGGQLRVQHRSQPNRVLWETVPGESFLAAARGEQKVTGHRGFFDVRDRRGPRTHRQTVDSLTPDGDRVLLEGVLGGESHARYTMELTSPLSNHLRFRISLDADSPYNRLFLTYASDPDERFFGFGEQFSHLDLKGRRVPILVQEQGIGRGDQPVTFLLNTLANGAGGDWSHTYAPAPQYLTTRNRALLLENAEYSVFDLREPHRVCVELFGVQMSGRIIHATRPLDAIEEITRYTGRMRALPDWVHQGAIVGLVGGEHTVRQRLAELRAHDVPVSAVFLQDWVGTRETTLGLRLWWNWEADPASYGDWPGFVRELREQGIRVLAYVNPMLVDPAGKPHVTRNLLEEAAARGYLVRNANDEPYPIGNGGFEAFLVDLTNPRARQWLKTIIKQQVLSAGVAGWMGDFGEALPFDARLHAGNAARLHNRYPEQWARLQQEAIADAGLQDQVIFFSRSGFTRSPGLSNLFWLGDQMTSWDAHDGIKTAVTGLLSSGMSGYALNHSDIGGYTSLAVGPVVFHSRGKELLLRWMELNALTAVYRTHDGLLPGADHQIDSDTETLEHFARMARLFRALFPYRRKLMQEAASKGYPVVRHPFLHYPDAPELLKQPYQFMLGEDLFVAPVLDPGRNDVQACLPPGQWVNLWTGEVFGNPERATTVTLPAPLGQPAALYRYGSTEGHRLVEALKSASLPGHVPTQPVKS